MKESLMTAFMPSGLMLAEESQVNGSNRRIKADAPGLAKPARRRFVTGSAAAGGLMIGMQLPFASGALAKDEAVAKDATGANAGTGAIGNAPGYMSAEGPELNAWVVIKPDDSVVIRVARSEMGQGTLTGLAQLVAEELECDWSRVSTEYPTPGQSLARKRAWGSFSTGGSRGIRESHEYVRQGGAIARMLLVQAAADEWKVPVSECRSGQGRILHAPTGRNVSYGRVAEAAAKLAPPDLKDVRLKDPKDWRLAGRPLARLDTIDKLNGAQIYGMDLQLPGMLNAAIRACPVFGGKLKSFDARAIESMPGVKKVVPVGESAVAVVADTWWRANKALAALPIVWDEGEHAKASSEAFAQTLNEALGASDARAGNQTGDAPGALATAAKKIEAVYSVPHQNHATMETMNATALWTQERCEVWTPTQNGEAAHAATATAAGLPASKCEVYKLHLGGGFGRRGAVHDWVYQAVTIAKAMPGTPIKLIWSREEDMQHGLYHPVTQCKLTAGLDADGNVDALHMRIAGQSILAGLMPQRMSNGLDPVVFQGLNAKGPEASIGYTIPNLLVDHAMRNPHVPPGFWRGVNLNQNTIYLECFIDEIAHETKQDPLALRRKLMAKHPRHLAVLEAVATKVGWDTPPPAGVFRGLAQTMGFGSYVAACAEVSVDADGKLRIHRIVAATDPGHAVNPQQIEAQIEGSFVYGLSAALFSSCTVKDGRIVEKNFDSYPVLKMADMPKVESVIVASGGFWGGVGEPTIAVAAPAVLNAIFAATGKRIRELPLKDQSLKRA